MRLLPLPGTSLLIIAVWCALAGSLSANSLLFGAILGVAVPFVFRSFRSPTLRVRSWPRAFAYGGVIIWDIILANITVGRILLFMPNSDLRPHWITVPLALTNPEAITVLAASITMTPGTLSADLSADGRALLVHCLHAPDPAAVRDDIKARYEARLLEFME